MSHRFSAARRLWIRSALVAGFLAAAPTVGGAAEPAEPGSSDGPATVDLFPAVASGELEARVIPKDETRVRLQLVNRAGRPLVVRIPAAIAAVPALGQALNGPGANFFGGPGAGAGLAGNRNGAQALGIGAGFGPGAGAGFGPPGGAGPGAAFGPPAGFGRAGLFNVPEDRPLRIDLPAVCLEFGKRNPAPRIPYELRPLEQLTSDPQVVRLVETLGGPQVERQSVQLAAWRAVSGWSWEEMAKMTVRRPWGAVEPRFDADELTAARRFVESLEKPAKSLASRR